MASRAGDESSVFGGTSAAGQSRTGSARSRRSRRGGDGAGAQSRFGREFNDAVVVPVADLRRGLAQRRRLGRGAEVLPAGDDVADALRAFLKRLRQKLEPEGRVKALNDCGARLCDVGEFGTARQACFDAALALCDDVEAAGATDTVALLAWRVEAAYGQAACDVEAARAADAAARYPKTAQRLFACLRKVQKAMADLLALPPKAQERVAWLILNGAGLIHRTAEPLAALGGACARHAAELLLWAAQTLDSCVSLATAAHLPYRCRLYALAARACDDAKRPRAAAEAIRLLKVGVQALRDAESMQLPMPRQTRRRLDAARRDVFVLEVRAAARLNAALADAETPEEQTAAVQQLLDAHLAAVGLADDAALRARAVFEALERPGQRGLGEMLEAAPLADDGGGGARDRRRATALALACADLALGPAADAAPDAADAQPRLSVQQLVALARELVVLGEAAAHARVSSAALQALEALQAPGSFEGAGKAAEDDDDLVDGAAAALRAELVLLDAVGDYAAWDATAAFEAAEKADGAARIAGDAARAAKKRKKKAERRDRRAPAQRLETPREGDQEEADAAAQAAAEAPRQAAPVREDSGLGPVSVIAAEADRLAAAVARAAAAATRVSPSGGGRPIPVQRARALADLICAHAAAGDSAGMLQWRPDLLTDVAIFLWRSVCLPVATSLDEMRAKQAAERDAAEDEEADAVVVEVKKVVTVAPFALQAPSTEDLAQLLIAAAAAVDAVLGKLDVDDALLRARVALCLGHALHEHASGPLLDGSAQSGYEASELRRASQVLYGALSAVDCARARSVRPDLHAPGTAADHSALARQSVTCDVDNLSASAAAEGRLGARGYGGSGVYGSASALDALHQALAATHLDLVAAFVLVELDLAKEMQLREAARKTRAARAAARLQPKPTGRPSLQAGASIAQSSVVAVVVPPSAFFEPPLAAEASILAAFRKHLAARAIAKTRMAVDRGRAVDRGSAELSAERDGFFHDAVQLLRDAADRERDHLAAVAPWSDVDAHHYEDDANSVASSRLPLAPRLLARSDTSITLQPRRWRPSAALSGRAPFHVRAFGKASGAGTDVSLTNCAATGLGAAVKWDAVTGKCDAVFVEDLCPNDSYVFAVAVFDRDGAAVTAIGETSQPYDAYNPLPLPLCYAFVAERANAFGCPGAAAKAAQALYRRMVQTDDEAGHVLRVEILQRASLAELHALVRCAGILADQEDNGGLSVSFAPGILEPKATHGDNAPTNGGGAGASLVLRADGSAVSGALSAPAQMVQYTKVQILLTAVSVSAHVVDHDAEQLLDAVHRCYGAMLPLLRLQAQSLHLLVGPLVKLHQALCLVPNAKWDDATRSVFSCLAHHLTLNGVSLLPGAPPVETLASPCAAAASPRAAAASPRASPRTEVVAEVAVQRNASWAPANAQQLALLETWAEKSLYGEAPPEALRDLVAAGPGDDPGCALLRLAAADPAAALAVVREKAETSAVVEAAFAEYEEKVAAIDAAAAAAKASKDAEVKDAVASPAQPAAVPLAVPGVPAAVPAAKDAPVERPERPAEPSATEAVLRDACCVARVALARGRPGDVAKLLASAPLLARRRLAPLAHRILDLERAAEVEAAATLAAAAAARLVKMGGAAATEGGDAPEASDASTAAAAAAQAAALGQLAYVRPQATAGAVDDADADLASTPRDDAADDAPAHARPELNLETLPSKREQCELLWLAEAEKLLALAAAAVLCAAVPTEDAAALAALASSELSLRIKSDAGLCVVAADGPLTDLTDALARGAFDGDDEGGEDDDDAVVRDSDYSVAAVAAEATRLALAAPRGVDGDSVVAAGSVAKRLVVASRHFARACVRARWARCWVQLLGSAAHLWNLTVSLWLSPLAFCARALEDLDSLLAADAAPAFGFSDQLQLDPAPYAAVAHALLDLLELIVVGALDEEQTCEASPDGEMLQRIADGDSDDLSAGDAGSQDDDETVRGALRNADAIPDADVEDALAELGLDAEWAARFSVYALRCLVVAQRWAAAVALGRRITRCDAVLLASNVGGSGAGALLKEAHALNAYAQQQLVDRSSKRFDRAAAALARVDARLEEAAKVRASKRRARPGRTAKVDRSPEEQVLDDRKDALTAVVGRHRAAAQVAEHHLSVLRGDEQLYRKARPLSSEALDQCRAGFAARLRAGKAGGKALVKTYQQCERLLRERREPLLLCQALHDDGDLRFADGDVAGATECWHEAVDAIFSTLDAHASWRQVVANAAGVSAQAQPTHYVVEALEGEAHIFDEVRLLADDAEVCATEAEASDDASVDAALCSNLSLLGCCVGGTVLGKLAQFSCRADVDSRLEHARFAARLFRAAFAASLPHPAAHAARVSGAISTRHIARDAAFAVYRPSQLGPRPFSLFGAHRRLSPSALARALKCCALALIDGGRAVQALPLCCLLEHAAETQFDVRATAAARLLRVRALTSAGLVAAAASAVASLLAGADLPQLAGSYAGLPAGANAPPAAAGGPARTFTTLPFFGFAPFDASKLASDESNVQALKWLAGDVDAAQAEAWCRGAVDADALAAVAAVDSLRLGCAGLRSSVLAAAYGIDGVRELALQRAELLAVIADCAAAADALNAADKLAAELQRHATAAAWGRVALAVERDVAEMQAAALTAAPASPRAAETPKAATPKAPPTPSAKKDEAFDVAALAAGAKARFALEPREVELLVRCALLRAKVADHAGAASAARQHGAAALTLLQRQSPPPGPLGADSAAHAVDAAAWGAAREAVARAALRQGRVEDAVRLCDAGLADASAARAGGVERRLLRLRCVAAWRRGDGADANLRASRDLLMKHRASDARDLDYARALLLAAALRRDAALAATAASNAAALLETAMRLLEGAEATCVARARDAGWIGVGFLTYQGSQPGVEKSAGGNAYLTAMQRLPISGAVEVDVATTPPKTPLANLYLAPVALLGALRCAMVETLLDLAAVADLSAAVEGAQSDACAKIVRRAASKAEEALATLRHSAAPPAASRAQLLLLLGRARRLDSAPGFRSNAAAALHGALNVSAGGGGHDHAVMRDAALELVQLHGTPPAALELAEDAKARKAADAEEAEDDGANGMLYESAEASSRRLQLATFYLSLAAHLAQKRRRLFTDTATVPTADLARSAFSKADVEEMQLPPGDLVPSRAVLTHLLALRREADEAPGAATDEFSLRSKASACAVHAALKECHQGYRDACLVVDLHLAPSAAPAVPEALVCIQWVAAPSAAAAADLAADGRLAPPGSNAGVYPFVEAFVLLGVLPGHARFGAAPHLLKVNAADARDVRAVQRRASELRYALQRAAARGVEAPAAVISAFAELLCDVHRFLNPHTPNSAVKRGVLRDSSGNDPLVPCDVETLTLLEVFFARDVGARTSNDKFCAFLRDIFEPLDQPIEAQ